jgi:hypothetical protein
MINVIDTEMVTVYFKKLFQHFLGPSEGKKKKVKFGQDNLWKRL